MGAVGYFIVAKFTPMASNGESGESAYVISGRAVESKLFFWGKFFPFKVGLNFEVKMKKKSGKYQWSFLDISPNNSESLLFSTSVLFCIRFNHDLAIEFDTFDLAIFLVMLAYTMQCSCLS